MVVPLSAYNGERGLHGSPYSCEACLQLWIVCENYIAIGHLGHSMIPRIPRIKVESSLSSALRLVRPVLDFGWPFWWFWLPVYYKSLSFSLRHRHPGAWRNKQKILCIPWWGSYGVTRDRFRGLFDRFCDLWTPSKFRYLGVLCYIRFENYETRPGLLL